MIQTIILETKSFETQPNLAQQQLEIEAQTEDLNTLGPTQLQPEFESEQGLLDQTNTADPELYLEPTSEPHLEQQISDPQSPQPKNQPQTEPTLDQTITETQFDPHSQPYDIDNVLGIGIIPVSFFQNK